MPRSATTRTREIPVSSRTSRRATASGVSPSSMVPLGNIHLPLPCFSNRTSGRSPSRRKTTPPALRARFAGLRVRLPVVFTRGNLEGSHPDGGAQTDLSHPRAPSPAGRPGRYQGVHVSRSCPQEVPHHLIHGAAIGSALDLRHYDRHDPSDIPR